MNPGKPAREMTVKELAAYIDHSVLKPEFTPEEVRREVEIAVSYGCKTVCINPASIEIAKPRCENTATGVCVVVDFPFGCSSTESRVEQTRIVLRSGVDELDVVANYGWIRGGQMAQVESDLRAVIDACHEYGVPVKVIFETDALTMPEIAVAAEVSIVAGADFIKTSTGFYTGSLQHPETGASDDMVAFMLKLAGGRCRVKGAGAIRDVDHFFRLIDAGIDRVGIGYRTTPVVLGDRQTVPAVAVETS